MEIDTALREELRGVLIEIVAQMNDEYAGRQNSVCRRVLLKAPTYPMGRLIDINEVTTRDE